jgi:hypothetical protein
VCIWRLPGKVLLLQNVRESECLSANSVNVRGSCLLNKESSLLVIIREALQKGDFNVQGSPGLPD